MPSTVTIEEARAMVRQALETDRAQRAPMPEGEARETFSRLNRALQLADALLGFNSGSLEAFEQALETATPVSEQLAAIEARATELAQKLAEAEAMLAEAAKPKADADGDEPGDAPVPTGESAPAEKKAKKKSG
jgi:hypothetical protein